MKNSTVACPTVESGREGREKRNGSVVKSTQVPFPAYRNSTAFSGLPWQLSSQVHTPTQTLMNTHN